MNQLKTRLFAGTIRKIIPTKSVLLKETVITVARIGLVNHFCKDTSKYKKFVYLWIYLNQNVFGRSYVDLQHMSSIQRRIHETKQRLVSDVRSRRAQISIVLLQYILMLVTIQQLHVFSIFHWNKNFKKFQKFLKNSEQ